jgi:hypothetical protein
MFAYLVEEVPPNVEIEKVTAKFRSEFDYARAHQLKVSKSDPIYGKDHKKLIDRVRKLYVVKIDSKNPVDLIK